MEKCYKTVVDTYRIYEHAAQMVMIVIPIGIGRRRKLRKQYTKETSTSVHVYMYIYSSDQNRFSNAMNTFHAIFFFYGVLKTMSRRKYCSGKVLNLFILLLILKLRHYVLYRWIKKNSCSVLWFDGGRPCALRYVNNIIASFLWTKKKKQYYSERHLCLDNRPSDSQYIYISLLIYFIINEIRQQPLFQIYKRPRQTHLL